MSNTVKLRPCPFCGGEAEFERIGSARHSCIVSCTYCGVRMETGEVFNCGAQWNHRHGEGAPRAAAEGEG